MKYCECCKVPVDRNDDDSKVVCSSLCMRIYKKWLALKEPKKTLNEYYISRGWSD